MTDKHKKYLYSSVATQIEVKLCWVSDPHVYGRTGRYIPTTANLVLSLGTEQSRVVTLLYNDECYTRLVPYF